MRLENNKGNEKIDQNTLINLFRGLMAIEDDSVSQRNRLFALLHWHLEQFDGAMDEKTIVACLYSLNNNSFVGPTKASILQILLKKIQTLDKAEYQDFMSRSTSKQIGNLLSVLGMNGVPLPNDLIDILLVRLENNKGNEKIDQKTLKTLKVMKYDRQKNCIKK